MVGVRMSCGSSFLDLFDTGRIAGRYRVHHVYTMKSMIDFSASLASARRLAGISQAELAAKVGTSQSAIARLEQGGGNPTLDSIARVAFALGFEVKLSIQPIEAADPVIALYMRDVDRTLLRENRRRTVDERIRALDDWQVSLHELDRSRLLRNAKS
jgi:transcriptional regulator with XRE-family HTH domain